MNPSITRRRLLGGLGLVTAGGAGAALSGQLAIRRAFAAEEAYVADRLDDADCLSDWGVDEGGATKRSSVVGPVPVGLRVAIELPYAYTTETEEGEPLFADTASEAVYDVTPLGTRRVRGDEISPCG